MEDENYIKIDSDQIQKVKNTNQVKHNFFVFK